MTPMKKPAHSIEYQFSELIFCNKNKQGMPIKIICKSEAVKVMSMASIAKLLFGPKK
jgi:hypothetical protein